MTDQSCVSVVTSSVSALFGEELMGRMELNYLNAKVKTHKNYCYHFKPVLYTANQI